VGGGKIERKKKRERESEREMGNDKIIIMM
jgi:hypothetical protein